MTSRGSLAKPRPRRLRFAVALLATSVVVAAVMVAVMAADTAAQPLAASKLPFKVDKKKTLPPKSAEEMAPPEWPNPYVSFLPAEAKTDWQYWAVRNRLEAQERRDAMTSAGIGAALFGFSESEPNDSQATADFISGFGTAPTKDAAVDVTGTFTLPAPVPLSAPTSSAPPAG